jgi:hypothetical protein
VFLLRHSAHIADFPPRCGCVAVGIVDAEHPVLRPVQLNEPWTGHWEQAILVETVCATMDGIGLAKPLSQPAIDGVHIGLHIYPRLNHCIDGSYLAGPQPNLID